MKPLEMQSTSSRRRFLSRSALIAAGVGIAGLAAPQIARAVTPALTFADIPGTGDVKVLNFALALEDLEADLYQQALMRLTSGGTNALGTAITGLGLRDRDIDVKYVSEFGVIEQQHRDFLRSEIRKVATPITPFKYNFNIQNLNRKQVDDLIFTAEKTGVAAYLGAIPSLATRKYLRTAGAIQGTEARHTAVIAAVLNQLFREGQPVAPLAAQNNGIDQPMTPDAVLAAVSPFIVTS